MGVQAQHLPALPQEELRRRDLQLLRLQGGAAEGPGEGGPREHGVPRCAQQGLPRLRGWPLGALLASTVVSAFPAFVSTYSAFVSVRSAVFSTCSLFVRTFSVFVTRQSLPCQPKNMKPIRLKKRTELPNTFQLELIFVS